MIAFEISLKIEPTSRRFPDDVVVTFRVPHYSTMGVVFNYAGFNDNFTYDSEINSYGLKFMVRHITPQILLNTWLT